MKFKEETIDKETLYEGKIVDLNLHDVRLPNGEVSKREIVNHPGAVAIIAYTADDKIIMVRQFRKALEKEIIEIPAGKLETGEQPEETAKRELEEETGYKTDQLTKIGSFYTSPGFSDEIVHVYEAHTLYTGTVATDDDEFVELIEVTLDEADKLIESGDIHDAKTMFAIQHVKLKRIQNS